MILNIKLSMSNLKVNLANDGKMNCIKNLFSVREYVNKNWSGSNELSDLYLCPGRGYGINKFLKSSTDSSTVVFSAFEILIAIDILGSFS